MFVYSPQITLMLHKWLQCHFLFNNWHCERNDQASKCMKKLFLTWLVKRKTKRNDDQLSQKKSKLNVLRSECSKHLPASTWVIFDFYTVYLYVYLRISSCSSFVTLPADFHLTFYPLVSIAPGLGCAYKFKVLNHLRYFDLTSGPTVNIY